MTKILAIFMSSLLWTLTAFLPRWKRLTVRTRLYENLQPFENVKVGNNYLKLFIPDRTCVYWAKEGPDCEPMTNAWISSFEDGETLVDIGANIGLYSLMAAAQGAARVYAFEPNPFSFSVLARNIVSNGFNDVIIPLALAISENSSVVTFKLGGLQAGGINNEIIDGAPHVADPSITTTAFSIDELFQLQGISSINHLKLDVDGLELNILQGAKGLLSDNALKSVLVEDNSISESGESEIVQFLAQFGFRESDAFKSDGLSNKIFMRI
ncbi:MAG: FkbM family methyltransferase [Rhodospirillales bacterium]|nr:FkbM family methyltransferase [Rhodospirillales bacterium]